MMLGDPPRLIPVGLQETSWRVRPWLARGWLATSRHALKHQVERYPDVDAVTIHSGAFVLTWHFIPHKWKYNKKEKRMEPQPLTYIYRTCMNLMSAEDAQKCVNLPADEDFVMITNGLIFKRNTLLSQECCLVLERVDD